MKKGRLRRVTQTGMFYFFTDAVSRTVARNENFFFIVASLFILRAWLYYR
jgi:hypothetical protein